MKEYWDQFITFAKMGAVTFGGGYAMLPMIQREVVEKHGWATEEEVMDYYAIGQCTPGIIAVNTATFVGCKQKGVLGGIVSTLGMVFPSLVIITVIAAFIQGFSSLPVVVNAFAGVRVCVSVLIINAVLKLWKAGIVDKITFCIFLAVLAASLFLDLSPVLFVVASALAGVLIQVWGRGEKA